MVTKPVTHSCGHGISPEEVAAGAVWTQNGVDQELAFTDAVQHWIREFDGGADVGPVGLLVKDGVVRLCPDIVVHRARADDRESLCGVNEWVGPGRPMPHSIQKSNCPECLERHREIRAAVADL